MVLRIKLAASKYDNDLKHQVTEMLDSCAQTIGFKLNKWSYIVQSQRSATCPLGWQHVYVDKTLCCGLRYNELFWYGPDMRKGVEMGAEMLCFFSCTLFKVVLLPSSVPAPAQLD